ncbi:MULTISPECIES: glycoside hydrolase family 28 protein [unclassified Leeuwenhoekiella]|uniref:glycoside hydrolase family 28 protein n=1 Tax=unclassified Leeuwenhoekiella TaxID=2615029 RepID=UPI000C363257|nr:MULTISPECIES: glycoside hydrolase family 28 protein [unclassified Leeuwenhoekiella]MAS69038.1 glycoside hydrolase [Zunongwangia sp.]MAW93755.1 glycoside hydrolase [Leeuwenhoekiella sp.]MBA83022.1 glycoside hydrolase [Leeuwenhoekiella sp.]|tara:strand:- start:11780 stop:13192 length:1413 start_codon:yes stop_codon:yes gene_type:complete
MNITNIHDFGAVNDDFTNNSLAIQKAIDHCAGLGGGKVVIPPGKPFLSGPFNLKSNIELHLEQGAVLKAFPDESTYTKSAFRQNLGEGTIWIGGENLSQVSITGGGTIDGNGIFFMGDELHDSYELKPFQTIDPRPHILTLVSCKNVKMHGITVSNAAYWALHFIGCYDISIANISIYNDLKVRNSDGIDLDHCQNVRISNCHIESGDDCICLKNRREYEELGPCKNIVISNCTLISTSCAIKIGSENMDAISHVTFNNCIITGSCRGIGIQNRDEGTVSDIIFSNIMVECKQFSDVWWGMAEPIYITAYPRASHNHKDAGWRLKPGAKEAGIGKVSNITFANIRCKSENGIFLGAASPDLLDNIRFNDIDLEVSKTTEYPGGYYDCRPCKDDDFIGEQTAGFYMVNASNVYISNTTVNWGTQRPQYYGNALYAENITPLVLDNFNGTAAFEHLESIVKKGKTQLEKIAN